MVKIQRLIPDLQCPHWVASRLGASTGGTWRKWLLLIHKQPQMSISPRDGCPVDEQRHLLQAQLHAK
jgi:hypothetical protein